jgi:hypothetical protein
MFSKKILSATIITCIIAIMLFYANATNATSNINQINLDSILENQEIAVEEYQMIREKLKKGIISSANYGGAYIDDEGNLNVNIVLPNKNAEKGYVNSLKKRISENSNVKFHFVEHSFKELERTKNSLSKYMSELGINMISVDERTNKVSIFVDNIQSRTNKIQSTVKDSSSIEIQESDASVSFSSTVEVINGDKITSTSTGLSSSLSFPATRRSDGRKGFVVSGHGVADNDTITYGGKTLGTVSQRVLPENTNADAAFVERREPSGWFNKTNFKQTNLLVDDWDWYTDLHCATYLPVGTHVAKYGRTTGFTLGRIHMHNVDLANASDVTLATYHQEKGDSGGTVTWFRAAGTMQYIIGSHMGSAKLNGDTYSVFSNIKNIRDELDIDITVE